MGNGRWARKAVLGAIVGVMALAVTYAGPVMARSEPERRPPGPPPGEEFATLTFRLGVECEPPATATFLGLTGGESLSTTPLVDSDGDGVYTGSMTVPKYGPGPRPVPPGIEPITLSPVRIVQGPPTGFTALGPEYRVIEDFGGVKLDGDKILEASVSFCGEDVEGPNEGNFVGEFIVGTEGNDSLDGGVGDDLIVARAGSDEVTGGPGHDALYAAYNLPASEAPSVPASPDLISGGSGNDFIDAADAAGAPDAVYCGPGADLVLADAEDFVADDCEAVERF